MYHTSFSWDELSDGYLNIIFSDFLGKSLEYMLGKGYKGEKVMNADCCGY